MATLDTLRNLDRSIQEPYEFFSGGLYGMFLANKKMVEENLPLKKAGYQSGQGENASYSPTEKSFQSYVNGINSAARVLSVSSLITSPDWPVDLFYEITGDFNENATVELALNILDGGFDISDLIKYLIVPFVDYVGNGIDNYTYRLNTFVCRAGSYIQPGIFSQRCGSMPAEPSDKTQNDIVLKHFKNIDFLYNEADEFAYYTQTTYTSRFTGNNHSWYDKSFWKNDWNMISLFLKQTSNTNGSKDVKIKISYIIDGKYISKNNLISCDLEIPGYSSNYFTRVKRFNFYLYTSEELINDNCWIEIDIYNEDESQLLLSWFTPLVVGSG